MSSELSSGAVVVTPVRPVALGSRLALAGGLAALGGTLAYFHVWFGVLIAFLGVFLLVVVTFGALPTSITLRDGELVVRKRLAPRYRRRTEKLQSINWVPAVRGFAQLLVIEVDYRWVSLMTAGEPDMGEQAGEIYLVFADVVDDFRLSAIGYRRDDIESLAMTIGVPFLDESHLDDLADGE